MDFSLTSDASNKFPLLAEGHYTTTRFSVGWDKMYIKTNPVANPFIQCWTAGYLEGVLSHEEIYDYYNNIHVFFEGDESKIDKLFQFYKQLDVNIESKLNIEYFKTLDEKNYIKWLHIFCLRSQLEGLLKGYSSMYDGSKDDEKKKLSLLHFYFINSEGNFEDIKCNSLI